MSDYKYLLFWYVMNLKDVDDMENRVKAHEIFYFETGSGLHTIWAPLGDGWTIRGNVMHAHSLHDVETMKKTGILMALDENASDGMFALLHDAIREDYTISVRLTHSLLMDGVYFSRNHAAVAIRKMFTRSHTSPRTQPVSGSCSS